MSIGKDIKVCFSEAHAGLGPAYLEIRFATEVPPVVFGDVLHFVKASFTGAVAKQGIIPQPIQQSVIFGQTTLTMELPQYNDVPKGSYLGKLDDCAMQFQNALPGLIRQLTAV